MSQFGLNKWVVSTMVLSLALTACKSTPMPDADATAEETVVETVAATDDGSAKTGEIKEMNIDAAQPTVSYVNPLNDPDNILSSRSIYFDYDSDMVKSDYRPLIEAHATYIKDNPGAKVRLIGTTDDRGTREYNLALGQRRSVSVKKTMNLLGVSDTQIETVSYGEERANTACADESCYSVDRRVDIVYTSEQ